MRGGDLKGRSRKGMDLAGPEPPFSLLLLNLPFGGVNNSGIGKSGGVWGFNAFSHERSVLVDKFSSASLLHPPYTPKVRKLIEWTIKLTT